MLCLLKGLFVFRNAEFICFFSEILQRNVAITCMVTVQLFFRGFYVRMGFDTIIGYCVLKFRVFDIRSDLLYIALLLNISRFILIYINKGRY